jgi:hypothetical protein
MGVIAIRTIRIEIAAVRISIMSWEKIIFFMNLITW